ncbi:ubiquitin carboxyl-terminal hydrolase, putative [Trypanosoma brucei brucei TREU927]|uniref:Ubiquitin carboxyl-terminal hydrolase n=1 Tax=Trypanosoma brucei brucei (strain 927/4 GUTat10.1) TaxID=185431 RepID=Q385Q4_TRYB2|nr:ubiquitin carboxyl-terminal hydrolase, putative [Trypanosoma brucei brucei TREU927]EAN79477.1 ubiquitin carboxyl-terminal hydrolase, putative [Trypanosoma brucei brucei TREU927]
MPSWCLIESDPAVFTELIQRFGAQGVAVEEIVQLEQEYLRVHTNVYGLILLFKWKARKEGAATDGVVVPDAPVFFVQQTVNNACATLSIVNILLNHKESIELGEVLGNFLSFTQDMNPYLRGTQVGECDALREAHNSFAPVELFSLDHSVPDAGDAYHFVSFVYKNSAIWELDGLQEGPILASDASDENYRDKLMEVVRKRIRDHSAEDTTGAGQGISFSLMAVVDDPLVLLERRIYEATLQEAPTHYLEEQLNQLTKQRAREKLENQRRRHNYVPMIVELLKALAEKGQLKGILDDALAKKSGQGAKQ